MIEFKPAGNLCSDWRSATLRVMDGGWMTAALYSEDHSFNNACLACLEIHDEWSQ